MNEYFTSLRAIAQSSTELLADQYHSLDSPEIKQSATTLRNSIQPCLDDLLQAQAQLGRNLIGCMKTLKHSEAVWQSKQQVIAVSNFAILEKVGEISGSWNRIQQLAAEEKTQIIEQAKQNWLNQIDELKEKSFFDSERFFLDSKTKRYRKKIGWLDKDGFMQNLPRKVAFVSESLDSAIKEIFNQLLQEFNINHLDSAQSFVDLLDSKSKLALTKKKESLLEELDKGFECTSSVSSDTHNLNLSRNVYSTIEEWRKRFGEISWEEVARFRDEGLAEIEKLVALVINDRLAMLEKVVEWALTFYNHFLSLQQRYQQETPEQRTAEKAWLDQQRQQLQQLLDSVEINLTISSNPFANHPLERLGQVAS